MRIRRHLAAAVALCAMAPAAGVAGRAMAQTQAEGPLPVGLTRAAPLMRWDPQVRYGRLPNGVRYAVEHVANPKGAVSIRLGVAAGSYQEAEGERGAAHLLEHLAFAATRSFGENQAALTFAPMKIAFGPDRNAAAELSATTYQADLPTTDPKAVSAALTWLRDAADGLAVSDAAVARAKAAALEELAGRDTPLGRFRERVSGFEDGGLRSAERPVLGTRESVAALAPATLRAFYDRWYRPENAVVVMVGDLPAEAMEQQVRATFGDWVGRGAAGRSPPAATPGGEGQVDVLALPTPQASPVIRICRVGPADDPTRPPPERLKSLLVREVWRAILQRRLNVVGTRSDAPFTQTNVSTDDRPDSTKTCIAIAPTPGGQGRAIALVEGEVRRFASGPTSEEVDIAIATLRSVIRGAIGGAPSAAGQAGELLQRALDGMPQLEPREGLRAFDVLLAALPASAVQAQFEHDWSGRGPLVTVAGPDVVDEAAIRAAMAAPAAEVATAQVRAPSPGYRPADTPERRAGLARAEQLLRAGDAKAARKAFDELVGRDRRDADALAGSGRAWAALGKSDPAFKAFAAALEADPANAVALNARGNLYVATRQPERALPDFDAALALNPRDDVVLYNRGLAFKLMDHPDRAIRDFEAALAAAPGDPLTLAAKADAYRRVGDLLLAREFYDAALAAQPGNAQALAERAEVRAGLGDAAGAAADRAKAREIDPSAGG